MSAQEEGGVAPGADALLSAPEFSREKLVFVEHMRLQNK